MRKNLRFLVILSAAAMLASCGGNSSSQTSAQGSGAPQTTSALPDVSNTSQGGGTSTSEKEFPDYTITFDSMGGSSVAPITVEWGLTALGLKPEDPVREGYTFDVWCWDKDYLVTPYDWTLKVTSDITLYARWISGSAPVVTSEEQSSAPIDDSSAVSSEEGDEFVEYWLVGENGTGSNTFSTPWKIEGGIQLEKDKVSDNIGILTSQHFNVGDSFKAVNRKAPGSEEYNYYSGDYGGTKTGWTTVSSGMGAGNVQITVEGDYKVYLNKNYQLWLDPVQA